MEHLIDMNHIYVQLKDRKLIKGECSKDGIKIIIENVRRILEKKLALVENKDFLNKSPKEIFKKEIYNIQEIEQTIKTLENLRNKI
jgi:uncharacterized membrane-anchored protein